MILKIAALILTMATQSLAQTPTTAPATIGSNDPQAVSALQSAVTAQMNSVAVQDVQLTGTAITHFGDQHQGSITLHGDAAGHSKVAFSLDNGVRTEYSSARGEDPGCTWSDSSGTTHAVANHNCWTDGVWFFPALSLSQSTQSGTTSLADKGTEQKNNASVRHLTASLVLPPASPEEKESTRALLRKLGTQELYLDSETSLPSSLTFATHPDNDAGRDIPIEVRFSDYRNVNGVMVPFHIEKSMNGSTILEISIESATFNTGAVVK